MKTIKLAVMAALIIFSVSCVANKAYRIPNSIERIPPDPPLAFIEFDDMGELHDPCKSVRNDESKDQKDKERCQLNDALNEIDNQKRLNPNLVVITFIHGWKNNADEKNKNVLEFKKVLRELRENYSNWSFMGVYLGWRGKLTRDPITSQLSFWNRRQAAKRVGTVSMTETILRLMHRTKEVDKPERKRDYKFIIVGHSFGGLILERAMGQALTGWVTTEMTAVPCGDNRENKLCFTSPADLVVLLNPALESIETRQLIEMLQRQRVDMIGERPFLVSITAQNDWATGKVLPLGHFFEAIGKSFLKRKSKNSQTNPNPDDCDNKAPSQGKLYTHTAGHLSYFFSHDVKKTPCEAKNRVLAYSAAKQSSTSTTGQSANLEENYYVCKNPNSCNKTPYWIMSVEPEIINGHNGIWRPPLRKLLITIMGESVLGEDAKRQAPETVLRYRKY